MDGCRHSIFCDEVAIGQLDFASYAALDGLAASPSIFDTAARSRQHGYRTIQQGIIIRVSVRVWIDRPVEVLMSIDMTVDEQKGAHPGG